MNKIQQLIFKMFGGLTATTIQQLRQHNNELQRENNELKRTIKSLNRGMNTWLENEGLITIDSQDLFESNDPIEKWNFIKNAIEDQLATLTQIGNDLEQNTTKNEQIIIETGDKIDKIDQSIEELINTRKTIQKDQEFTKQAIIDLKYDDIIDISNFENLL
jgi:hypothetical protein